MTLPPVTAPLPADPHRALDALDRAVAAARTGAPDRPLTLVSSGDFRTLSASQIADVRARLDEVLMSDFAEEGLDALLTTGALDALLPEVKALVGFGDGEWRHKDVWKHTKQVVRQAEAKLEVRWSALLHDVGKVKTRSISPEGEVHFFGHAEVGARMFDKLEKRTHLFGADEALRESVRFLILHHLRAAGYDASWTDSAVRRFGREMGEHLPALLCLARADITTKRPEKKRKGIRQIEDLYERLRMIQEEDAQVPPLPKGIGDGLMAALAIPPSRLIGEIKRALEAEVETGALEPHREIGFYVDYVLANAERFGIKRS
jgi:poly(A) polymerase